MKKYVIILFLMCVSIFASAAEQKVYDFSMSIDNTLDDFEKRLQDYWRFPENNRDKIMASEYGVLLRSFQKSIDEILLLLKYSGLRDVEEVSGKSVKVSRDGDFYFRNTVEIEYDENSKGFLPALLKKLPPEKLMSADESDDASDLHLMTDDTAAAFYFALNFKEAVKSLPQNSASYGKLNSWSESLFGMKLPEFADQITGEWGGLVNMKKLPNRQHGNMPFEFLIMIPDPDKKLFSRLGEYLMVRKMAKIEDKILTVHWFKFRNMMLLHEQKHLIAVSSPELFLEIEEKIKQKKICDKIKRFELPLDIDKKNYFYRDSRFDSMIKAFFAAGSLPLKFMDNFTGNDSFSTFESDDGEIEIIQKSTASLADAFWMPYRMNLMVHCDNLIFNAGKKVFAAGVEEADCRKCVSDMKFIAEKLKLYAKAHGGKYPQEINQSGLQKLVDFCGMDKKIFSSKDDNGKELPFKRFYYWGGNFVNTGKNTVLLSDRGGIHQNHIHVLFCDGTIREFKLENVRSALRIAGFLHTLYHYDSATFENIVKQAEKLDSEKL